MGGKYTTESGNEVRIYAVDGVGAKCVHGSVYLSDGWYTNTWNVNGKIGYNRPHSIDLVEVWQPEIGEVCLFWKNDKRYAILLEFSGMRGTNFLVADSGMYDMPCLYENCMKYTGELPPQFKGNK